jgi:hypothetical protein
MAAAPEGEGARVVDGPIIFVVELRRVVQAGLDASGPTIRVLGVRHGHEYLRLDMFAVGAHYHYEPPDADTLTRAIDQIAALIGA